MFQRICAVLCASLIFLSASSGQAARVSPMVVEMEPSGRAAVARINLYNEAERDIPFEVRVVRADISVDGELAVIPADEDFLVFPAQVILEPRSQQVFRLQYVGEPQLFQSETYYMSIRQVPVDFEDEGVAQVQVVVNYNVLVNVVPPGAEAEAVVRSIVPVTRQSEAALQADVAIEAAENESGPTAEANDAGVVRPTPATSIVAAEQGAGVVAETQIEAERQSPQSERASAQSDPREINGIEVLVGNEGNRYFLAGFSAWTIAGSNLDGTEFETTFKPGDIARQIGAGVVGPSRERLFFLPLEDGVDRSSITIEIDP